MDGDPILPATGAPALPGLPAAPGPRAATPVGGPVAVVPAIVAAAGERAARRFLEFFAATIRNPNTRAAYHARPWRASSPGASGTASASSR